MNGKYSFTLFADYFQFYLQDESVPGDLSRAWTPETVDRLLALAPGTIGVGTVRNMDVPVEVELVDGAPSNDLVAWDRVNECSISLMSGRAIIAGCTDYRPDAARLEIPPNVYRVRIYYGGLATVSDDGFDGSDHYRIVLWPGAEGPVVQLKAPSVT